MLDYLYGPYHDESMHKLDIANLSKQKNPSKFPTYGSIYR